MDEPWWAAARRDLDRLRAERLWTPGPATMLDVLQASGRERAHQLLIGWLLDPRQPHDLGTAVLARLLTALGKAHLVDAGGLDRARVELEVVQADSRADIVVSAPAFKLVIELKVHAGEGDQQTARLADAHTGDQQRELLLVFLTLHGDAPRDTRFTPMPLRAFGLLLRRALAEAPEPRTDHTRRGRETAADLRDTLERMTGMAAADQAAARIWLAYGEHLPSAKVAARELLKQLPAAVQTALTRRFTGRPVKVVGFRYTAYGHPNAQGARASYDELAVLLTKPEWRTADGSLAGIGYGARIEPDPFDREGDLRPFLGVRAEDPGVFKRLNTLCAPQAKPFWDQWPRWEDFDLSLPDEEHDLVEAYADRAADRIEALWRRHQPLLDEAVARHAARG